MATQLHEVEFEPRTIGPLVLTTPVLRRLEFRGIVNRYCPIAEQAELDHGVVAELVTQSRLAMGACRCGVTCYMAAPEIARHTPPNLRPSANMSGWRTSCRWRTRSSLATARCPRRKTS